MPFTFHSRGHRYNWYSIQEDETIVHTYEGVRESSGSVVVRMRAVARLRRQETHGRHGRPLQPRLQRRQLLVQAQRRAVEAAACTGHGTNFTYFLGELTHLHKSTQTFKIRIVTRLAIAGLQCEFETNIENHKRTVMCNVMLKRVTPGVRSSQTFF